MLLVALTPIESEIDHYDLTNRVGIGHVCSPVGDLQCEAIAAPEGEEPPPVAADASVPRERYTSVQKMGVPYASTCGSTCTLGQRGDRPLRPAPVPRLT